MGRGRTSINGVEVHHYISISIIIMRDSIMATHIICRAPLIMVSTSGRCTSSIYLSITIMVATAKGMGLITLTY